MKFKACLLLFASIAFASSSVYDDEEYHHLSLSQGWNLAGIGVPVKESLFNYYKKVSVVIDYIDSDLVTETTTYAAGECVDVIWYYNADNKEWLKLQPGDNKLGNIQKNTGLWIKASQDCDVGQEFVNVVDKASSEALNYRANLSALKLMASTGSVDDGTIKESLDGIVEECKAKQNQEAVIQCLEFQLLRFYLIDDSRGTSVFQDYIKDKYSTRY